MTFGSLLIVLVIFILSGLLVMRPFLEEDGVYSSSGSGRYNSLMAERERLLSAIEELDQALDLDKISAPEHEQRRTELLLEAAAVIKKIEELPAAKKEAQKQAKLPVEEDELERMIAERRKVLQKARVSVCPSCGEPVVAGDQFCSKCGAELL